MCALDPMVRAKLQFDLKNIFAELEKTVILVTHSIEEAAYLSAEVVLMRDGGVVQRGSLLHRPAAGMAPRLKIGSKRFTESYILADIAADVARASGDLEVVHEEGLGGTAVVFRALEQGSIDVYPEYTGTLAEAVLHTGKRDLESLRAALAAKGIEMTDPLGFDNTYALAVAGPVAARRHLVNISDLAGAPDLRL